MTVRQSKEELLPQLRDQCKLEPSIDRSAWECIKYVFYMVETVIKLKLSKKNVNLTICLESDLAKALFSTHQAGCGLCLSCII